MLVLHRPLRVDELLRVEYGLDKGTADGLEPARAPYRQEPRRGLEHKVGRVKAYEKAVPLHAVQPAFPQGPFSRERPLAVSKPLLEAG